MEMSLTNWFKQSDITKKNTIKISDAIIELICWAFFLLFVYTAFSKWISYKFTLGDLQRSPLLGHFSMPIFILVPSAELLISILLIQEKTRRLGLFGAVILMLIFTLYVGYVLSLTKDRPCSCGGIIRELDWHQHMQFNICFLLLAILGYILQRRKIKHYA